MLSELIGDADLLPALVLAGLVVFVIRPSTLTVVLLKARMSWPERWFIGWFGPRGLNSLLLALLVVVAGVPGSELLLAIVGVVVLASVVIHGATAWPVAGWYGRKVAEDVLEEERENTAAALFTFEEADPDRISPADYAALRDASSEDIAAHRDVEQQAERDGGR